MSLFLLFSVSYTIQNHSLPYVNLSQVEYAEESLFNNESSSSSIYHLKQTKFYPYLPIQIYTENRERFFKLKNKTTKIILLANEFFTSPTWYLKSLENKTNEGNSM
jgi:hypothetical protein